MKEAQNDAWLNTMREAPRPMDSSDEILDPGRRQISRLTDDELAELMSREPNSKQGQIAASVLRTRESWRTPARWALIVSLVSLVVSGIALSRSL